MYVGSKRLPLISGRLPGSQVALRPGVDALADGSRGGLSGGDDLNKLDTLPVLSTKGEKV